MEQNPIVTVEELAEKLEFGHSMAPACHQKSQQIGSMGSSHIKKTALFMGWPNTYVKVIIVNLCQRTSKGKTLRFQCFCSL